MTKKAVTKRIRVTKNGKLIRRKMAQDHFRANKTGKQIQGKRGIRLLTGANKRTMLTYLNSK